MFCPDLTFRPRMSVLSAEQMEQIHQAPVELLEARASRLRRRLSKSRWRNAPGQRTSLLSMATSWRAWLHSCSASVIAEINLRNEPPTTATGGAITSHEAWAADTR